MLFSKECMPKKCCQITFNILVIFLKILNQKIEIVHLICYST